MNLIMDNSAQHLYQLQHHVAMAPRADIKVPTTPPRILSPKSNHCNNNNKDIVQINSPTTGVSSGRTTLKRSFDVAFLMLPDERIQQKQAEKQARLSEALERHQHPTDLSPRQLMHQQHMHLQHLHDHAEFIQMQETRRYPQIMVRSPRIYDDPSVIIPTDSDALPPMKSAFTKVLNTRMESPIPPPPLSPDQLSCPSISPPLATTPPRTNSGNGSLSNGSSSNTVTSAPPHMQQNIVYHNFRPEYSFNGAFHSVNQVHALQAAAAQSQRLKQQLLYRPPIHVGGPPGSNGNGNSNLGGAPPEFMHSYPGFPFPPGAAHSFAGAVAPPLQNPAAAAILSTLIPPTLASTFTLTAQNVCAKCNISFRMTSDLVYHMRSHHKSEVACDPNRRKREEKLKCPVCNESFRERHHLTRHMTAHQDKESDATATNSGHDPIINVISGAGGHINRHHARSTAVSK